MFHFYYLNNSKNTTPLLLQMTTLLTPQPNPRQIKTEDSHTKNVLKNKQDNRTNSKQQSKHIVTSQEKQNNAHLKKSVEKGQIQQNYLLAQKKGNKSIAQQNNNLRNIIQNQEEQYKQSKPFNKKYGTQNNTNFKNPPTPPAQLKHQIKPMNNEVKNKTRQSFNKKLISNIIKDEQTPNSKNSYRIKKVENHKPTNDGRSPKKIRDDLIALNEEQYKLQMEILQIHKSTKQQLQQYKQTYKFNMNNAKKYFPQLNLEQIEGANYLQQIAERLKQKQKELVKMQAKVQSNPYLQYLKNTPEDIMELHSSEEQDEVEQLPDNRPRLQNNMGSYATSMASFKDKKHGLNLRRTYDIFKQDDKQSRITHQQIDQMAKQQKIKQDGQNKMTINNKLKDFLLS